jgi:hypothetical protein
MRRGTVQHWWKSPIGAVLLGVLVQDASVYHDQVTDLTVAGAVVRADEAAERGRQNCLKPTNVSKTSATFPPHPLPKE